MASSEKIQTHRGRVVDMAGDSVLAVFEAATGAVRAAFEIQAALGERNQVLNEARRMRFRIGVKLGEVIERPDGTVYGDGVNIAARLQALGESGGVPLHDVLFPLLEPRLSRSPGDDQGLPSQDLLDTQFKHVLVNAELGELDAARVAWNRCQEIYPKFSVEKLVRGMRFWNHTEAFIQRYLESVAKAGYVLGDDGGTR